MRFFELPAAVADRISRSNTKAVLLGGFAAVVLLCLVPVLLSGWAVEHSSGVMNRFIDVDEQVATLSLSSITKMVKVRRNEKDFLLSYRDFGFLEAKSRYITTMLTEIKDIKDNMAQIRKMVPDREMVRMTADIDTAIDLYQSGILKTVDLIRELGTDKSGLEGELRSAAQRLETLLGTENNNLLLLDVLDLRNREKDFLLQDTDAHFAEARAAAERLRADVEKNVNEAALNNKLTNVIDAYAGLVRQYEKTGDEISELRSSYLKSLRSSEPTLEKLHYLALDRTRASRAGIQRSAGTINIVIIVSFFLAILLSLAISLLVFRVLKAAEDRLQVSERKYRSLFETSPDAVMIVTGSYEIVMANRRALQLLGYEKADELIGRRSFDFIAPEDRLAATQRLERLKRGEVVESSEYRMITKSGEPVTVEGAASLIVEGRDKSEYIICVIRDISERIRAEEQIRFLASILENLPDAVCAIDKDGHTTTWNKGGEKMLGYKAQEMIGKPITAIIPEDIAQKELDHCLRILNTEGYFSGYESIRKAKDGRRVPVELTGVAIRDREQNIRQYASIVVDISDRKKAEQERLKSHMLESIGLLAGGIAHDFNNLLTIILGNIQMALLDSDKCKNAHDRLEQASKMCTLASDLSKRLITFSTGGDPVTRIMSPGIVIRNAVMESGIDPKVSVTLELLDDLPQVAIDEAQIRQVVNNLMMNAAEAMPHGGSLVVRGENLTVSSLDNIPIKEGKYLKLSFRDTGIGIASDNLAKIFDPYYSTKDTYSQKGLGLGLAVCYSVITRHGGLITVESEVGRGTVFFIYLPAA
jgi:PAS domain S-box-containing protein